MIETRDIETVFIGDSDDPEQAREDWFAGRLVELDDETTRLYREIIYGKDGFFKKVGKFFTAESKAGRIGKMVTDFALLFIPYGKQISRFSEFATDVIDKDRQINLNQTNRPMLKWLKARLKEPGSYKALSAIGGLIGLSVSPELWKEITAVVVAVISLIQFTQRERPDEDNA